MRILMLFLVCLVGCSRPLEKNEGIYLKVPRPPLFRNKPFTEAQDLFENIKGSQDIVLYLEYSINRDANDSVYLNNITVEQGSVTFFSATGYVEFLPNGYAECSFIQKDNIKKESKAVAPHIEFFCGNVQRKGVEELDAGQVIQLMEYDKDFACQTLKYKINKNVVLLELNIHISDDFEGDISDWSLPIYK